MPRRSIAGAGAARGGGAFVPLPLLLPGVGVNLLHWPGFIFSSLPPRVLVKPPLDDDDEAAEEEFRPSVQRLALAGAGAGAGAGGGGALGSKNHFLAPYFFSSHSRSRPESWPDGSGMSRLGS